MSTQEQRERWAKMFGWTLSGGVSYINCELEYEHEESEQNCRAGRLPDFSDIRGPYFGPAVKELLLADWVPSYYDDLGGCWDWSHMSIHGTRVEHDNLGVCTMLALEAKRQQQEEVK